MGLNGGFNGLFNCGLIGLNGWFNGLFNGDFMVGG